MPDVLGYVKDIERAIDERGLRGELGGELEDLRVRIEKVARIVKFPVDGSGFEVK